MACSRVGLQDVIAQRGSGGCVAISTKQTKATLRSGSGVLDPADVDVCASKIWEINAGVVVAAVENVVTRSGAVLINKGCLDDNLVWVGRRPSRCS